MIPLFLNYPYILKTMNPLNNIIDNYILDMIVLLHNANF